MCSSRAGGLSLGSPPFSSLRLPQGRSDASVRSRKTARPLPIFPRRGPGKWPGHREAAGPLPDTKIRTVALTTLIRGADGALSRCLQADSLLLRHLGRSALRAPPVFHLQGDRKQEVRSVGQRVFRVLESRQPEGPSLRPLLPVVSKVASLAPGTFHEGTLFLRGLGPCPGIEMSHVGRAVGQGPLSVWLSGRPERV